MKLLILQAAGEHPENARFRECLCLQRAFQRLGAECVCGGPGFPDFGRVNGYNAVLIAENYDRTGWVAKLNLAASKPLRLFWSIDPHCVLARHIQQVETTQPHIVLCAIDGMKSKFANAQRRVYYMPNAYPSDLIDKRAVSPMHDLGFCGSVLNREPWLRALEERHGLKRDVWKLGDAMVDALCSYRIGWNRNKANDINYRTFETMGCGTCLLTNNTDRLLDLFTDWKHLVTYTSVDDCCEKVAWLLRNPRERQEIADAGYAEARAKHTYDNRAKWLLDIITGRV
jgi:hypothetical protein